MQAAIITSPATTEAWLRREVLAAERSILVAAPYVGAVLRDLLLARKKGLPATLVTSLKIGDVLGGASDLAAIYELSTQGVRVQSISNLHAKVYMVDDAKVLVTSANPTMNGWRYNLEIGLAVQSEAIAQQILQTIHAAQPYRWTSTQLKQYVEWAAGQVRARPKPRTLPVELVRRGFGGWLGLVMGALAQMPEEFTLLEAYERILPLAAQHYPANRHPKDKIRQQLQGLRDLGLLEFVTPGRYRRLQPDLSAMVH
ncbi:MAG: phospholipase D-like domain-containing protein [Meiothermus ruber]|uniref:phospholipase D-like domain-containing protein n=1 Tax=Meiothermus ruber TaxID=277 RepID=UPI0039191C50